jgi:hypothetical protein
MALIIPKIIFIIPYRNREKEKTHFSIYMKYIMEDYAKDDYEIYYSHQTDSRPFNRGASKNIGFIAMKNKYPHDYKNITFVFNDIDTLPAAKNTFNYITTKGVVKHFYGFIFALGGIFSINGDDFEKCNGFPNNWGWGLEDNAMQDRVLLCELKIDRDQFYPLNSKEVIHLYDNPNRLVNNNDPGNYIEKKLRDNLSNIYELNYTIENHNVSSITPVSNITPESSICESNTCNKISLITQNEYMINISNFRTLVNPANEIFYNQNTFYDKQLRPNIYEASVSRNRWGLPYK